MATIKYLLQSNSKNVPIYLRLSLEKNKSLKRKTGLYISPRYWSSSTGWPIQNNEINKNLTTELRKLSTFILDNLNKANSNGVEVNGEWLLHQIDLHFDRITEDEKSNLLTDYIQYIIDNADTKVLQGGRIGLSKNRIKGYVTFKGIIEKYQEYLKKKIDFKDIDIIFEDDFRNWLIKKNGYSINYAGKNFDNLKAVCNDAMKKGKKVNDHANHLHSFKESKDDKEVITLNFDELEIIEKIKKLTSSMENVRKWLLLGCEIGQRGGDLLNITEKNLVKRNGIEYIDVTQQKTGKTVTIPVRKKINQILKIGFPYKISIQKFNNYLKDLCQIAEIDDSLKGRLYDKEKKRKIEGFYPKHELITSHICRRSFATNFYKQVPTAVLMVVTGHSKESLFLTYIGEMEDKVDIPVILTPHSGDVDPPADFGSKDKLLTNLQFFS